MDKPALLSTDALTIYLNDHLAGATAGVELVRRAASENEGSEFGAVLRELCAEIQHDREELIAIITGLGYPVDRAKIALGWTAEKVGRLKPNGRLRGYSPLGRLLELEGLLAGIHAKQALWRALLRTGTADPKRLEILLTRAGGAGRDRRADASPSRRACDWSAIAHVCRGHSACPERSDPGVVQPCVIECPQRAPSTVPAISR